MTAETDCHEISAWVQDFRRTRGRAPKVLHIGNIANNGYRNAKFLRELGFDCHVLCYDYFHAISTPEWDEAEFEPSEIDQFMPDWTVVATKYKRPNWFIQGTLAYCFGYIEDIHSGSVFRKATGWYGLGRRNRTRERDRRYAAALVVRLKYEALSRLMLSEKPVLDLVNLIDGQLANSGMRALIYYFFLPLFLPMLGLVRGLLALKRGTAGLLSRLSSPPARPNEERAIASDPPLSYQQRFEEIINVFKTAFPDRRDQLTLEDLLPYSGVYLQWCQALAHYDVVQAYATDPILPLLAERRPYVAFEHGTLRTFTVNDNQVSRLTAIGYLQADHVFITNGDCREYADRLGIVTYTPIPHPIDDRQDGSVVSRYRALHLEHGVRYLFLCPLRHDWAIKGTDQYIRALPLLRASIGDSFRVLMTSWGAQVDESKALAESLDVAHFIVWLSPLNRQSLIQYIKSVDIVFDQIALPHFGATAPESIGVGTPVIMSYRPESTQWIIPEPAPILPAFSPQDIALAVVKGISPDWRQWFSTEAKRWFNAYHSWQCVAAALGKVYIQLIDSYIPRTRST